MKVVISVAEKYLSEETIENYDVIVRCRKINSCGKTFETDLKCRHTEQLPLFVSDKQPVDFQCNIFCL